MSEVRVRAGRRAIVLSSPDKPMFPPGEDGGSPMTKLDLARHYERVAPLMVPLVRDRPLTMQSFPAGVARRGIFIQEMPGHFPDWIRRVTVPKRGGEVTHALANDAATLVYLANQNCVTPHVWLARADSLDRPDRLVFDLDPSGRDFAAVRAAAAAAGDLLRDVGLVPFAMTTGSRGVHVVAPLRRTAPFDEVRAFARDAAGLLVAAHPDQLTTEQRKAKRGERLYLDVTRNAYAQHVVAPYAVRARPGAPVATPLHWEELGESGLRPDGWTIGTLGARLPGVGDPWAGIARSARALGPAQRRLERLRG